VLKGENSYTKQLEVGTHKVNIQGEEKSWGQTAGLCNKGKLVKNEFGGRYSGLLKWLRGGGDVAFLSRLVIWKKVGLRGLHIQST